MVDRKIFFPLLTFWSEKLMSDEVELFAAAGNCLAKSLEIKNTRKDASYYNCYASEIDYDNNDNN